MAKSDWRRYSMIVYDVPFELPRLYYDANECREDFERIRKLWLSDKDKPWYLRNFDKEPLAIVHVRGKNSATQRILFSRSL